MDKKLAIGILLAIDVSILAAGGMFIVYSVLFNVYIKVLNANVHGAAFGLLVLYFGIRYMKKLTILKKEVEKPENRFSWSNFSKDKKEGVL